MTEIKSPIATHKEAHPYAPIRSIPYWHGHEHGWLEADGLWLEAVAPLVEAVGDYIKLSDSDPHGGWSHTKMFRAALKPFVEAQDD